MSSYADVPALPVVYLDLPGAMVDHVPRGDVLLYAGAGQIGKGTSLVWMAVATALQGHHVAVVFPEDDPETAVRPRLDAAVHALAGGLADDLDFVRDVLGRIHDLTTSDGGAPFVLDATGKTAGSVPALRAFVDNPTGCECPSDDPEHRHPVVRLVVIDPLLACLEGSVATNIGARRVLGPLMGMAKETGAALILSQHVVFVSGKAKVAGSQGLTDTVRWCYIVEADKYNAALRVVRVEKANGVRPDPVRFSLAKQPNGCMSVTWLDADELAARRTGWRQQAETPTVPVLAVERKARAAAAEDPDRAKVLAWLHSSGGGDVAAGAKATGLTDDVVMAQLAALQADGVVGTKRRLVNPLRAAR